MALIPYMSDFEKPLRMMEREFFRPNYFFAPSRFNQLMPRDFFSPFYGPEENVFRPWKKLLEPMEQMSGAMNRLMVNEMRNISSDKDTFQVNLDVQHFSPEEISVKVMDGHVVVQAKHEEKEEDHSYVSREFVRRYVLPKECLPDTVESKLSSDGVLTVKAPKVLVMPSPGERIVPIKHTGPVQKKLGS